MTWMSCLIELAFEVCLLWPAVLSGAGLDRPIAYREYDCSCNPCVCTEKCVCAPCKCDGCPVKPACPSAPCTQACPAYSCPQPCTTPVAAPAVPQSCEQARCYEVSLRVAGDGCCKKGYTCPHIRLLDGAKAIVSVNHDGKGGCRLMHVQVAGVDDHTARLHLQMTGKDPACPMKAVQVVHLDTVTGVVMCGNTPEPCCAQVIVRPIKVAPPQPAKVALPHPMPVQVYQPMPAPLPIVTPIPSVVWGCGPMPVPHIAIPSPCPMLPCTPPPCPPQVCPTPDSVVRQVKHVSTARAFHVELCKDCSKNRLHMHSRDGISSKSVRMTIHCDEAGALHFAAGKKYVHISGKQWKACAEHVNWHDDGRVVLTGNVKLQCHEQNACEEVRASRVTLRIKDGKCAKVLGVGKWAP